MAKKIAKFYMTYEDLAPFLELGDGHIIAVTVEPEDIVRRRFRIYVERDDLYYIGYNGVQRIDKENFIKINDPVTGIGKVLESAGVTDEIAREPYGRG